MQARALVLAAALIVGAAAFAPRPSPATVQRFKVAETNHQIVDLSSFGQPEQTTHIVTSTYVTVNSTDSAGGKAVKLVIDSVHADSVSAQGFDPSVLDSLKGVTATAASPTCPQSCPPGWQNRPPQSGRFRDCRANSPRKCRPRRRPGQP